MLLDFAGAHEEGFISEVVLDLGGLAASASQMLERIDLLHQQVCGLLNGVGTVSSSSEVVDAGLGAFCISESTTSLWGQGWVVCLSMWNVPHGTCGVLQLVAWPGLSEPAAAFQTPAGDL